MGDSAIGSLTGYLFQFEKALFSLVKLQNPTDYISIESVDDIATHEDGGAVLMTFQAKHSILSGGTTFEDTSKALWRTLEIWIQKLEKGIFNNNTDFVCSTNKTIPSTSLITKIKNYSFENVISEIKVILDNQKAKRDEKEDKGEEAKHIKYTIKLIEYVLNKEEYFKIIKANLSIEDNADIKNQFFNELHLNSDYDTQLIKDTIYEEFYGWITIGSYFKWKNSEEANFSKKDFDNKYHQIRLNPSIVNIIFRTKESLGTITSEEIIKKRTELFVKQLEDIKRRADAKERIIETAILDFIYSEIEIQHIITKGDYTEYDFTAFMQSCKTAWQEYFDNIVINEIENYNEEEKNSMAIDIYNTVMTKLELNFKEGFTFTSNNKYIRNGCFLKLSNIPDIGWRPDWETKYKI